MSKNVDCDDSCPQLPDWEEIKIEEYFNFINGTAFYTEGYSDEGHRVIDLINITPEGSFQFTPKDKYVSEDIYTRYPNAHLYQGDLIIIMTDINPELRLMGKAALIDNPGSYVLNQRVGCLRLKDNGVEKLDIRFIRYLINSDPVHLYFKRNALGSAQFYMNTPVIKKLILRIPPLAEQRRIAEILGTWDEAIALTGRLIDALRDRKKGLMQLLLSGEVRFSDYTGKWQTAELNSVCLTMESGGTPSTQVEAYWDGDIPWITGADFGDLKVAQVRRYITEEAVANSSTKVIDQGNILLVSRTGVGKMAVAPFPIAISQDITGITPNREVIDTHFLLYYLAWSTSELTRFNQGTSINGVTRDDLKRHQVAFPGLDEQRKIAEVLRSTEVEIELLQEYCEVIQTQKSGLMQQLLTGQIRVGV